MNHHYNVEEFTWGCELELGDVPRSTVIPLNLGRWEYAETDIINQLKPYKYVAADPLGLEPPVGGEINTHPTKTIEEQLENIERIFKLFKNITVSSSIMEFHIHVRVPGLINDTEALKRLTRYVVANQQTVIDKCVGYVEHPKMKETKTARTYLKLDMGRKMPLWMVENIEKCKNFQEFIHTQCCGKNMVRARPIRYCINTYCLKHTETIEFRCFRASLDLFLLRDCFYFVRDFMNAALNGGATALEIINDNNYEFPKFIYNHEEYLGWESTKWSKERGKKKRTKIDI